MNRIFLLSPANCGGRRAKQALSPNATFALAAALRSEDGAAFIRTLARGAVRERMLFRRLASAEIEVPAIESQLKFAHAVACVERARAAAEAQLKTTKAFTAVLLRRALTGDL